MSESKLDAANPDLPGPRTDAVGDTNDRGLYLDQTVPPVTRMRELTPDDFVRRQRRRVALPLILFLATSASTFWAGAANWAPLQFLDDSRPKAATSVDWEQGFTYMLAVIAILLTHEMGHFLQTLRYRVPASLPYFIPVPILPTGTMGAVIGMEGSRADRKQLFDIGISGPWAGLLVALPIAWFGIKTASVASPTDVLGDPMVFKWMAAYLRPELQPGAILSKANPLLMAGWVGMLITGLNMLPISQLDGGHVIYGLFGRRARLVSRGFAIASILYIVLGDHYSWTLMLVIVILLGIDHPPTRDDSVHLGPWRYALGVISLAMPVICFTPILM